MTAGVQLDFGTEAEAAANVYALMRLMALDPTLSDTTRAVARAIHEYVAVGEVFSPNEIRGHLPPWAKPNGVGPAFNTLLRRGVIEYLGTVTSTAKSTHGKRLNRYRVLVSP